MLLGSQCVVKAVSLANLLKRVLDTELAPHSLAEHGGFSPGGVKSPLLVCHGDYDAIVDSRAHREWHQYLKPGDRLWSCPQGRHFFHYDYPGPCSQVILDFWKQTSSLPSARSGLPMPLLAEKLSMPT
ncbi:MAG: alpha/beta hydrolase [Cyanobacteria bacterium J06626_18]